MRRTQLYLEEAMWKMLSARARQQRTTVSELVREAVQEKFGDVGERRRAAMQAFVGIWADRKDLGSAEEYVRALRRDTRPARWSRKRRSGAR
jgi:hypothetical protein